MSAFLVLALILCMVIICSRKAWKACGQSERVLGCEAHQGLSGLLRFARIWGLVIPRHHPVLFFWAGREIQRPLKASVCSVRFSGRHGRRICAAFRVSSRVLEDVASLDFSLIQFRVLAWGPSSLHHSRRARGRGMHPSPMAAGVRFGVKPVLRSGAWYGPSGVFEGVRVQP